MFHDSSINPADVSGKQLVSPIPLWEQESAEYDIDYIKHYKGDNPNVVGLEAHIHINDKYSNHLQIYTDGSVSENGDTGAGFVIAALNITESFYLGKGHSIYTAELTAILMALRKIDELSYTFYNVVVCVDSKSVLQALQSKNIRNRSDLVLDILHMVHSLIINGTMIHFCWIPSHTGISNNEWADKLAKQGAKAERKNRQHINIPLSAQEMCNIIKRKTNITCKFNTNVHIHKGLPRSVSSLAYRLCLNSWKTKYCAVKCICDHPLSLEHVLHDCVLLKQYLTEDHSKHTVQELNFPAWLRLSQDLLYSPIGSLL